MAAKNGSTNKAAEVQAFVKEQLADAQKRFQDLMTKGKESSQKLLDNPTVKKLGKRAGAAGTEMMKQLDSLQNRMIEATGMATQSQIRDLNKEIGRLSRKVDSLLKGKQPEARA